VSFYEAAGRGNVYTLHTERFMLFSPLLLPIIVRIILTKAGVTHL